MVVKVKSQDTQKSIVGACYDGQEQEYGSCY